MSPVLHMRALVARSTHAPLDLSLERSRRVSLVAPNGTGKSSLLRCVVGALAPLSGSLVVRGRVGYAPQAFAASLFPWLTARQNIELAARNLAPREARLAVDRALSVAQLHRSRLDSVPDHLSGGQRQLVCLARSVAFDPEVLLLDEPFSALDPAVRSSVIERLDRVLDDRSCALLLVSHLDTDALSLGARPVSLVAVSSERAA